MKTAAPQGDRGHGFAAIPAARPAMTPIGYAIFSLTAIATIGLASSPVTAQSPTEKAERDELAIVANNDPTMAAAMRKARATLMDFLAIAAAPKSGMDTFAVKVAIREGKDAEYFWISPFNNSNGRFSGVINNTPRMVHNVRMGQTITFSEYDIVDWMYMDGGKMKGNYTACALLKSASPVEVEQFKKRFGADCNF
ncbi:MAG: DUF2314 domain-containing protein [Xanthobacteraceae bacterium]